MKRYIKLALRQPFFSAGSKYGWDSRVPGIGIDMKLVRKSIQEKRDILVSYKNTNYEISGDKALKVVDKYASYFMAKDTLLAVIPQDKFKRLPEAEEPPVLPIDVKRRLAEEFKKLYGTKS